MKGKINRAAAVILALFVSSHVWANKNPVFSRTYDILLPVDGNEVPVGRLLKFNIEIDEQFFVQSHYRSKLQMHLDCDKIEDTPSKSLIYPLLLSSCKFLGTYDEAGLTTYTFDAFADGVLRSNALNYKVPYSKTLKPLLLKGTSRIAYVPGTYLSDGTTGWYARHPVPTQYITLFMSEHHKLRLSAILNDQVLEPGINSVHSLTNSNADHYQSDLETCHYSDNPKAPPALSAEETKYSYLSPKLSCFPLGFDDAINSQEPLLLSNLNTIPLGKNILFDQYATFLPFYPITDSKGNEFKKGEKRNKTYYIASPTGFAFHTKISAESDLCLSEESSKKDPEYKSQRTKIRYCRSTATYPSTWSEITLFENEEPILIFRSTEQVNSENRNN